MSKFVLVVSVILFASCSGPKYTYYFGSSDTHQNDNFHSSKKIASTVLLTKNDPTTASLAPVIYAEVKAAIDTGIVSIDSIAQKKPAPPTDSYQKKAERKRLHQEKEKAYQEAKKAYAATKDKRFDGFAIAGAVFFTASFLCMFYPGAAIVFAVLGLIASILGLKSRIWGLSAAALIGAGVVLTLYIFLN
ncbi:MAG TPA: hypothetical protein VIU13_04450, partial [Chryseolinea sp.]